jgi:hypothetical protein
VALALSSRLPLACPIEAAAGVDDTPREYSRQRAIAGPDLLERVERIDWAGGSARAV